MTELKFVSLTAARWKSIVFVKKKLSSEIRRLVNLNCRISYLICEYNFTYRKNISAWTLSYNTSGPFSFWSEKEPCKALKNVLNGKSTMIINTGNKKNLIPKNKKMIMSNDWANVVKIDGWKEKFNDRCNKCKSINRVIHKMWTRLKKSIDKTTVARKLNESK